MLTMQAATATLKEATEMRGRQEPDWWKLREAGLRTAGMVCGGNMKLLRQIMEPNTLIEGIVVQDLADQEAPALLKSRAVATLNILLKSHSLAVALTQKVWFLLRTVRQVQNGVDVRFGWSSRS